MRRHGILGLIAVGGSVGCSPDDGDAPPALKIRHDADGEVISVRLPPGAGPRADGDRLEAFRAFVDERGDVYDVGGATDLLDLRVVGEFERAAPVRDVPDRAILRLVQEHRGIEILGGPVIATFVDDRIRRISGTVRSRDRVAGRIDALLEEGVVDVAHIEAALGAGCRADGDRPSFDPVRERLVHLVHCDDQSWLVDAGYGRVVQEIDRYLEWAVGSTTVRSVADGTADGTAVWIPSAAVNPPTALFGGVLVDYKPYQYQPWNCTFRMSYVDVPSRFPFATIRDGDGDVIFGGGVCNSPMFSPFTSTADPNFEWQVALTKTVTAARHARWQHDLAMFAVWPAVSEDPVDVLVDPPSACGGSLGLYDTFYNEICLDAANPQYNHWRVPLHEYSHHIEGAYGLIPSGVLTCEQRAFLEGMADALTVNFEHFRYDPLALSSFQLDALFRLGPGAGMTRANGDHTADAGPGPAGPQILATEPSDSCDEPNYDGMVLAQILWKLLNNRYCPDEGCLNPQRILTAYDDATMAFAARDMLIYSFYATGSNGDRLGFLEWYEDEILTDYGVYFDAAARDRLELVFCQHNVGDCPPP